MEADAAEGVLYYDGSMAGGVKADRFVKKLENAKDVGNFVQQNVRDGWIWFLQKLHPLQETRPKGG